MLLTGQQTAEAISYASQFSIAIIESPRPLPPNFPIYIRIFAAVVQRYITAENMFRKGRKRRQFKSQWLGAGRLKMLRKRSFNTQYE